jgi:hypothetical protein
MATRLSALWQNARGLTQIRAVRPARRYIAADARLRGSRARPIRSSEGNIMPSHCVAQAIGRPAVQIAESVDMLQRSYAMRGVVLLAPGRVLCRLRRSLPAGVSLLAGSSAGRDVPALSPHIVEHHLAMR